MVSHMEERRALPGSMTWRWTLWTPALISRGAARLSRPSAMSHATSTPLLSMAAAKASVLPPVRARVRVVGDRGRSGRA